MTILKINTNEYTDLANSNCGLCLCCGEIKEGQVEPDAEEYECDACGEFAVEGIENALICGHLEISN